MEKAHTRCRPYRTEYTRSLPNSEVNRCRARLVLVWGTDWEHPWVLTAFFRRSLKYAGRGSAACLEKGVWEKGYAAVLKCAGKGSAIWGSFLSADIVISSENPKFFGLTAAFFKTQVCRGCARVCTKVLTAVGVCRVLRGAGRELILSFSISKGIKNLIFLFH